MALFSTDLTHCLLLALFPLWQCRMTHSSPFCMNDVLYAIQESCLFGLLLLSRLPLSLERIHCWCLWTLRVEGDKGKGMLLSLWKSRFSAINKSLLQVTEGAILSRSVQMYAPFCSMDLTSKTMSLGIQPQVSSKKIPVYLCTSNKHNVVQLGKCGSYYDYFCCRLFQMWG